MNKNILLVVFAISAIFILVVNFVDKNDFSCVYKTEEKIVNGKSLQGIIANGDTTEVLFGYYDCNKIKRNDVVLYNYAGNKNPLIKIIKGIPGDNLGLQKNGGRWNILIDGKVLENSENIPYLLDNQRQKMISLYQGIISENEYLLLGNLIGGAIDSTKFGLVWKNNITGKVQYNGE